MSTTMKQIHWNVLNYKLFKIKPLRGSEIKLSLTK